MPGIGTPEWDEAGGTVDQTPSEHASTHRRGAVDELTPEDIGAAEEVHNLIDTTNHPASGLTAGHFLKATGETTYDFEAHGLSASDVGALAEGSLIHDPYDEGTHTGLDFSYGAGLVRDDNIISTTNAGTVTLTDDSTNYIEVDPSSGVVSANTTGFTEGQIPLYEAVTVSGEITVITDRRAYLGAGGASELPEHMEWVNTETAEGLAVYDDPPTNSSMVALIGRKGTLMEVYKEDEQADFEKGELDGVEATADGLELSASGANKEVVGPSKQGGYLNVTWGQDFEVYSPIMFVSALVDSQTAGNATFAVYKYDPNTQNPNQGDVIHSQQYSLSAGENNIKLNWEITETGYYWIGATASRSMYRSDGLPEQYPIIDNNNRIKFIRGREFNGNGTNNRWYFLWDLSIALYDDLGQRISIPQDLTSFGTDPNLRSAWQATEPEGTSVTIETAVTGETWHEGESIGTGVNIPVPTDINFGNTTSDGGSGTTFGHILFQALQDFQGDIKVTSFHASGWQGAGTAELGKCDDADGTNYQTLETVNFNQNDTEVIFEDVELEQNGYYVLGHDGDQIRHPDKLWPATGTFIDVLKSAAARGEIGTTPYNRTYGFSQYKFEALKDTFYLDRYPAERHDNIVVKVDGTPTEEFTRPDENNPKKIVFNEGHEPGHDEPVTADYTGVDTPSETAEVQTLYLGGATGGTFDLGISGNMATLAYNDDAATIQAALEAIFGTDRVTVEADADFTITFDTIIRSSSLEADFTSLTGATDPSLSVDTAYSAGDWEEQTSGEAISNIPAGDLTGKHLWIRQTLETTDTSVTPTLNKVEVYYGEEEYGVFTTSGTVGTF